MSTFPGSHRLEMASIVTIDQATQLETVIQFQYNPESLSRRLISQAVVDQTGKIGVVHLKGPPEEMFELELVLDATDQLERADPSAVNFGIYPKLSALELLLYPKSTAIIANSTQEDTSTIEIKPIEAPLTLFVLGKNRTIPVLLTNLSILEEAFDPNLNPIRAKVSLQLRVLDFTDLGLNSRGGQIFLQYLQAKESMAAMDINRAER
jgi:hypothetical protein